jgi:short-subunit dehydrogenase
MASWQTVWITGGGSGIGLEVARQLAKSGTNVVISGRNPDKLQQACDEVKSGGITGSIQSLPCDVTNLDSVKAAWLVLLETQGIPDLVLLNAGDHQPVSLDNFDPAIFEHLMKVNFHGVVNCLASVIPAFCQRGHGHIGVVASVAGYQGLPTASAYGATKAALINAAEALYPELKLKGVDLSLINPGFVRTPLTDRNTFEMPFLIDPEPAAERIILGLQKKQFEIAFPTRFVILMKLLKALPYWLYFKLTRQLIPKS